MYLYHVFRCKYLFRRTLVVEELYIQMDFFCSVKFGRSI